MSKKHNEIRERLADACLKAADDHVSKGQAIYRRVFPLVEELAEQLKSAESALEATGNAMDALGIKELENQLDVAREALERAEEVYIKWYDSVGPLDFIPEVLAKIKKMQSRSRTPKPGP